MITNHSILALVVAITLQGVSKVTVIFRTLGDIVHLETKVSSPTEGTR